MKRNNSYKNFHRQEYINPEKIFKAMSFLKNLDNPFYQSFSDPKEFKARCENQDPDGYQLLYGEEYGFGVDQVVIAAKKKQVRFISDENENWDEIMELREYLAAVEDERLLYEEMEYRSKDPIRKFQIDYDKSVCLYAKFPEAFHVEKEDQNLQLSVAPGEGKVPENILISKD